ncbi:MAG: hypothetical protein ACYDCK_06095 [Thermoplasmatota archaeon]
MRLLSALSWKRVVTFGVIALTLSTVVFSGVSDGTTIVVTGEQVYYNGDHYDPCLASIIGLVKLRVVWFNELTLTERYNGNGTFLYVVEHNASDPRTQQMHSSGVVNTFIDPNGHTWEVDEWYWDQSASIAGTGFTQTGSIQVAGQYVQVHAQTTRYYAWTVAIQNAYRDGFAGSDAHRFYNFVTVVDTCKMHNNTVTTIQPGWNDQGNGGDPNAVGPQIHGLFNVDLYVGSAPLLQAAAVAGSDVIPNNVTVGGSGGGGVGNDPGGGQPPGAP